MAGGINSEDYRPLTKVELLKAGYSTKSRRYIEKWRRRVRKDTPTISLRKFQQSYAKMSLEKRAKLFKQFKGTKGKVFKKRVWIFRNLNRQELNQVSNLFSQKESQLRWQESGLEQYKSEKHWIGSPKMLGESMPGYSSKYIKDKLKKDAIIFL
ncbi:MAG: hypothetical protein ACREBU_02135 [Nitrososphaera sp.]